MKKIFIAIAFVLVLQPFLFSQNNTSIQPQIYAIVVGISKYLDGKIPNLKFADKDALSFAEFLKTPNAGAIPDQNMVLLTNEKATRSNILKALVQLVSRSTKEDLLIFYFSGHGKSGILENTGYLLTYDTENDNEAGSAVSMDEVKNIINHSSAKMKVSYIDACHAGLFTGEGKGTSNDNEEIVKAYMSGLSNASEGNVTFMASSARQESLEDEKMGHGIFTYYLLKGLQGEADKEQKESKGYDDGLITISEMETYLSNKVQQATKYKQKPSMDGKDYDEYFPLGIVRSGLNLSLEIGKRPKNDKKIDKQMVAEPITFKTPADEKLPSGMTLQDGICWGQYGFVNMTKEPLILIAYTSHQVTAYDVADIKIAPGATGTTPRIFVTRLNTARNCEGLFIDYIFLFKKMVNGAEQYTTVNCTIESGKKKYLLLNEDNLSFSTQRPQGM